MNTSYHTNCSYPPSDPLVMVEKQEVQLAPATSSSLRTKADQTTRHQHIKTTSIGVFVFLLLAIILALIVLIFTLFKVKNPSIKLNNIFINATANSTMSMIADVSVKNPNMVASFRFNNTTTDVYYGGIMVGEAHGPPGQAEARRTLRMNVTVDIETDRLLSAPSLSSDMESGQLNFNSYTRVPGKESNEIRAIKLSHCLSMSKEIRRDQSGSMSL
ncbi:hypothetical protein Ancab_036919 [Ancistrocladus abbreviatus]